MTDVIALRHELHAAPELSGVEHATAERVRARVARLAPDDVITGLGGAGVAVAFGTPGSGPTILLRAELDALPIHEANEFAHRSRTPGCAHLCGHDGHMAILAAVGERLASRRPRAGRVVLLFQPAEETGAGAAAVLDDPRFERIRPDAVFALHNLPGFPTGHVVVRAGTFACASRGMTIRFRGHPAHAAEPERGLSPAAALARTLLALGGPLRDVTAAGDLALVTVVGATMGGRNFGIAPGDAEVHVTLRSGTDATMARLVEHAEAIVRREGAADRLAIEVEWSDVFDATINAPAAVDTIRRACSGLPVIEPSAPMRWSEDFGRFTRVASGALFGLGAGEHHPPLHSEDYDFPDELIATGADILLRIVAECLPGATTNGR